VIAGLKAGREGADGERVGVSRVSVRAAFLVGALGLVLAGCSPSTPLTAPPSSSTATVTVGTVPRSAGPTVTVTTTPAPSKPAWAARVPTPVVSTPPAAHAATPSTLVAHVLRATTAYSSPTGGHVVGTLAPLTRGVETWVPILSGLEPVAGRVQVRFLQGRTVTSGWAPASNVDIADTLAWVEVEVARHLLTVHVAGAPDRTWKILALGDKGSSFPTPVGSFWIERFADFSNLRPVYGPAVRAELSARGTWAESDRISFHAWRAAIRPGESSHGCMRVPDDAATLIGSLPYGAPVEIRP